MWLCVCASVRGGRRAIKRSNSNRRGSNKRVNSARKAEWKSRYQTKECNLMDTDVSHIHIFEGTEETGNMVTLLQQHPVRKSRVLNSHVTRVT